MKVSIISSVAMTAFLTACGGGGGGESAGPAPAPAVPPAIVSPVIPVGGASLVTSVAAATYSPTTQAEELAAFTRLNVERNRCGFGLLAQSSTLDISAKGHADWQLINNYHGHFQVAATTGFTGITPLDRAIAATYTTAGATVMIHDEITSLVGSSDKTGFGVKGVQGLLAAPYHAVGLLSTARDVGISIRNNLDASSSYGSRIVAQFALGSQSPAGPQMLAETDVQTYPCAGSTEVMPSLENESPNPVPGRDLALNPLGSTVIIVVREGQILSIASASMINKLTSAPVTLRTPMTALNDPNGSLKSNQAFISADAPLLPQTQYEVTVSGTNSGNGFTKTFTFTTGS